MSRTRDAGVLLAQGVGSALILALLVRDAQGERVWEALRGCELRWLGVAVGAKALALVLHELRLWVALLPWGGAPLRPVLAIGFVSGLVNTALPMRGGDLLDWRGTCRRTSRSARGAPAPAA